MQDQETQKITNDEYDKLITKSFNKSNIKEKATCISRYNKND